MKITKNLLRDLIKEQIQNEWYGKDQEDPISPETQEKINLIKSKLPKAYKKYGENIDEVVKYFLDAATPSIDDAEYEYGVPYDVCEKIYKIIG